MSRIRSIVGVLAVAFVSLSLPIAAQGSGDLIGVLVLNGKGYAVGRAQVTIHTARTKPQEPIVMEVCAEAAGFPCKVLGDGNPAARVTSLEYELIPEDEVTGWEVTLTLHTADGELKPCYAAGTTLPAQVSCGPTPEKQTVRFNLSGGGH